MSFVIVMYDYVKPKYGEKPKSYRMDTALQPTQKEKIFMLTLQNMLKSDLILEVMNRYTIA